MIKNGMLTIISKNYLSAARVLCRSFLRENPGNRAFVLLVDTFSEEFDPEAEEFELIVLDDIRLPDPEIFPYQYDIMELNTAVKPFVARHIFDKYEIENLLYLDPDIWIHGPLDAVWRALEKHSIVLIPHIRKPFDDIAWPNELQILQSGTYNLGFVGLKNNEEVDRLLAWWCEKTDSDCVVDIENGLFVDQKWMDLIPGYFENTHILHEPEYNVAYWNLHEREVTEKNGRFYVDGRPLKFFHFSGFDPRTPDRLSKHENRHDLDELPAVRKLCDLYTSELVNAGIRKTSDWPYGFGRLPNGIPMTGEMNLVVRHCRKKGIPFPSPTGQSDEFCRFLMTPNAFVFGQVGQAPFVTALLKRRPDLVKAFPDLSTVDADCAFLRWMETQGVHEANFSELYKRFGDNLKRRSAFARVKEIYESCGEFSGSFSDTINDPDKCERLNRWLRKHGHRKYGLTEDEIDEFVDTQFRMLEFLDSFFFRTQLQKLFTVAPCVPEKLKQFFQQMVERVRHVWGTTESQLDYFIYNVEQNTESMLQYIALYNWWVRQQMPLGGTFFGYKGLFEWSRGLGAKIDPNVLGEKVFDPALLPPLAQLENFYASNANHQELFPSAFNDTETLERLGDYVQNLFYYIHAPETHKRWLSVLREDIKNYKPDTQSVNLAGYFRFPAGMGQSVSTLRQALDAAAIQHADFILPGPNMGDEYGKEFRIGRELPFGWHNPAYRTSITVVNSDVLATTRNYMPASFWLHRRNIAYWVWETERFPDKFSKSADGFSEIWTPSRYSAKSIQAGVQVPVRVVPHVVPVKEIPKDADRKEFGLPGNKVVFAFFFDELSVVERKNPAGLLRAFRKAFKKDDPVLLMLKVLNYRKGGLVDTQLLKMAEGLPVTIIPHTLPYGATMRLMACIDVYASLHRSEGFGLTMAEAMSLGKPVIATGYSGNVDYMNDDNSLLVNYEVVETNRAFGAYPAGTRWAEADSDHAAHCMRQLLDEELRADLGKRARVSIRKNLSAKRIGRLVKELLRGTDKDRH